MSAHITEGEIRFVVKGWIGLKEGAKPALPNLQYSMTKGFERHRGEKFRSESPHLLTIL